ncbi:MAG: N-acetylglucosamine-6-phosphate deacetylase [Clostridia bacterium]|nr:N-acetylglucosamine-6-phosphate deacetylase [Clostridia bacterium]
MLGFKNVKAYIYGKGIVTTDVAIKDGKIAEIGKNLDITESFPFEDGQVLLPGFIDQHIHGADNADAMDGSVDALVKIAKAIAKEGTTSFLATTMTQSPENITNALKAVKEYNQIFPEEGAKVLGVHLEGPFISTKHIGAQPLDYVANPDVEIFKKYQEISGNAIKIVSLAPEVKGASELIAYLKNNGVVASVGHADASYVDMEKAVSNGLTNVTHTYNCQKPLHHRDVGTVGSAYLFDELNCEIICDLIHLSIPAIKLVIKNKPHDKVTLITDSMRAKYLPDGLSELGGQEVIVKNGEARLNNGALAGSILKMNNAVKNLVLSCNVKFTDAVDFATANPAKNLGLFDQIGSIEVGKNADFTVLNEEFEVCLTVRGGKTVYKK